MKKNGGLNAITFIEKAKKIHGNKYDYSKVKYVNCDTKVCIICPKHGEFWQTPYVHNNLKCGCPKCGHEKTNTLKAFSKKEFIEKAKKIHGNKYDYVNVEYKNNRTKVCITCPKHGEFWQEPSSHLSGCGCIKCSLEKKSKELSFTRDEFIKKAREIHGDKYDYSKVEYVNARTKICIICPDHGEFWQTPDVHINSKCGCPKCGSVSATEKETTSTHEFVMKAKKIHGDKYDYSKVNYVSAKKPIEIICQKHGSFFQIADAHLHGCGCPRCSLTKSKGEDEIFAFLNEVYHGTIETRVRKVIPPFELDIFLPDLNKAIEYNGLRWHSDEFQKDKNYHLKKLEKCNEKKIGLISVFEDEWTFKKEIIKNKILHLLFLDTGKEKVYARNCEIKEINKKIAGAFLEKNHIQGKTNSTVNYGAFYKENLIGVMSFKKTNSENNWELVRFATDYTIITCGVGGKLFKHFIKQLNPNEIKSFADRRWTLDPEFNLYVKLGFKLDEILRPDYRYVVKGKRVHKFNFRKNILHKKYGLNLSMTEKEMTENMKIHRIYDCGLLKYIWRK